MFSFVTLEDTKKALVIEHNDDDDLLELLLIPAASRSIHRYLKGQAGSLLSLDSPPNSPPDVSEIPDDVRLATIYLVGQFYKNRDTNADGEFADGDMPQPVKSLLYRLRDPALA